MSHSNQEKWLLALIWLNIFVSLGHYIHNIVFLPEYHEPGWITPALIDSLWFVMTPFSSVSYVLFFRRKFSLAFALLYVYCGLSLLVLGHYWITPSWTLSSVINVVIFFEAIAVTMLANYVRWLQAYSTDQSAA